MRIAEVKKTIREIPDFPKPGITFYDVSTLFRNGPAFRTTIDRMYERFKDDRIDVLAGIEARGFVLASALAYRLEVGQILVRKQGKLPGETEGENYTLEYGDARIEVHRDAVERGERVVVIDDLLATAGTAVATGKLLERLGARVAGYGFMVELDFLGGRGKIDSDNIFSLIHYS